jgi:hypothetical protein
MMALMKVDNDGQDLTQAHPTVFGALAFTRAQPFCPPLWLKFLAKLINEVE